MKDRQAGGSDPVTVPLSYGQQLLWFLNMLQPGTAWTELITARLRVTGPLDVDALSRAASLVVERHDSLRSVRIESVGAPVLRVERAGPLRAEVVDLTDVEPGERAEATRAFFADLQNVERDVFDQPLLWVDIARFEPGLHLLSLTAHHAACDAWSMSVLIDDLVALYRSAVDGTAVPGYTPKQHSTFALEQQQQHQDRLDETVRYWAEQLDAAPISSIPLDQLRQGADERSKRALLFELEPGIASRTHSFALRRRCTPFMVLLTAFELVVYQMTDALDITVPTLTYGRRANADLGQVSVLAR